MFEVGKEVICLDSSGRTTLKKGEHYTAWQIQKRKCCGVVAIDVGHTWSQPTTQKCSCGKIHFIGDKEALFYNSSRFAPIDNSLSELTTADILNEPQHA